MAGVIKACVATMGARWRIGLLLALALFLSGCGTAGYYAQSIRGHLALMHAARPIDDWLRDPAAPAQLRQRLEQARAMRAFAVDQLGLPDNASYHGYAELGRRAAVWSVAAAPPDSLVLRRWCFPVVGCVGYRGYYDEAEARAYARHIGESEGLEVMVYPVPAYSTLGWLNWAGGDPLLSTFIAYPEGELARILFHELAHQQVYLRGDTRFNESYATAVARLGVARWLELRADPAVRRDFEAFDRRRQAFRALARRTRDELSRLYAAPAAPELALRKAEVLARFREDYATLKAEWVAAGTPYDGFDSWVAQANNASFGLQAVYDDLVPAFEALFEREGADWARFHAAVRALARLPAAERGRELDALAQAAS